MSELPASAPKEIEIKQEHTAAKTSVKSLGGHLGAKGLGLGVVGFLGFSGFRV